MKRMMVYSVILLIIFLSACSGDEVRPDERFNQYINHWNEQEFDQMYDMFTANAKENYTKEESVLRQHDIYEDLNASEMEISTQELSEEDMDQAMSEGEASIPFSVTMNTLAGDISFNYEATLIQEDVGEDEQNWFVQWDSGFIFPDLKDGGQISVQSETPRRGEILDRNQMPLAINDTVQEVGIIPGELGDNAQQNKEEIARLLNISVDSIDTALNADWVEPNLFVPIETINDESLLSELTAIDGVTSREQTGRIYPSGEAAAHLVGYIRPVTAEDLENQENGNYGAGDMIGARGLEQLYEDELKGETGYTITVTQENGEETVLAEKAVQDGENISVTIDVNIQEKIYESYGEDAGTAAAIHPETGETLALVSSPAFDPNEVLYGTSGNYWEELEDDEQTPVLNRFSATYAPGSVFKPITAAIGLQNGTIDPDEGLEIDGLTWSNGEGWGDYEVRRVSTSDGPVDLQDALVRSDNIYFAMQAVNMGADAFVSGLEQFGFGEELPYEYPITGSTISADGEINDEVLLANTSYGQGEIEMSALHLAASYTPILNGGDLIKPTLLTTEDTGQVWQEGLITEDQAQIIQDALRAVVTDGTAQDAQDASVPLSGKTGTAELKLSADDESGEENGWFVGYPTEEQDILIAMMVEQVQDKGGSGHTLEKFVDAMDEIKE